MQHSTSIILLCVKRFLQYASVWTQLFSQTSCFITLGCFQFDRLLLLNHNVDIKIFFFILVSRKLVFFFEIKKQGILNISLIIKGFVFLVTFACSTSDVFRGLKEKRQNDVLCGNVNMDASPKKRVYNGAACGAV